MWFIAFADDLCVIALSPKRLEVALNTLHDRMLESNLTMRCLLIFVELIVKFFSLPRI